MKARESAGPWIHIVLAVIAVGFIAILIVNTSRSHTTQAQSPQPTSTFTPLPGRAIGDTVWRDDDGDGVQDFGEPGIPGVTVDLNDPGKDGHCGTADDEFREARVTDGGGNYLFTDVPVWDYYCVDPDQTTVPAGYSLTTANDPERVDLIGNEDFLDADFGYQPPPLGCSGAVPSIATLWPPNHRFVAVNVLGVQGDSVAITIDNIYQDEPVATPGSGSTSPDGWGVDTATAHVRAERAGGGNGRVYHIGFTAEDGRGDSCSGEVLVGVPHSDNEAAVDDGALYDSTAVIPWP